jgi:hypothetical protein
MLALEGRGFVHKTTLFEQAGVRALTATQVKATI